MAASCKHSLERNSAEELKAMFKILFEAEYYSERLQLQQSHGLHIRLETAQAQPGCVSKATDLEETILEDVSNSNGSLSTLVIGDSGTGKSWLALNLTKKLYNSAQLAFQNKIPVYIPLGRIEKMISQQKTQASSSFRSDVLFSYIMNHRNHFPTKIQDGELQNLYLDLCACELILVLDGYDELKLKSNLWEENKWKTKDFTHVRTIVFCRPKAFVDVDISKIFGFSKKQESIYFISPIMRNIVEKYICQVPLFLNSIEYDSKVNDPWMMTKSTTKDYPKWESAKEDSEYKYWFLERLPELQGLAQNVFILTTICQLLPKLVESERNASKESDVLGDDFVQKLEETCRTEVLLYDKFTQAWFKYQIERMEPTRHAQVLFANRYVLRHYMVAYAQNLAMRCASLNAGKVLNGEISEDETLFWNLWTPWSTYSKKFKREKNRNLENILFPRHEQDKDVERIETLKFLRDSCLLRYNACQNAFGFLHLSLFEYFLSREVFVKFRGVLNYYSNWDRRRDGVYFPINQKNIKDPEFIGVLSMLVSRAKTDEQFQRTLLETIKKSATLPGIEQMASNAFTILNLSGYSFSGRNSEDDNFQNIQVPGANFRNSVCGNSDFSGANFENAELNQGWFQGCKFQGVNFSKCSFGQTPPVSLGTTKQHFVLAMFSYSIDDFFHIAICYKERVSASDVVDLYVKTYKFQVNFDLIESKETFLRKLPADDNHSFFFIEDTGGTVILLIFIPTSKLISHRRLFPGNVLRFWYEFEAGCLVGCGTLDLSTLCFDALLNIATKLDFVQKYIVFFPNEQNSIFVEEEKFMVSGTSSKVCSKKYLWFAFGRFKILVSIRLIFSKFGTDFESEKVSRISMLHNDKPILGNEESLCFELFWKIVSNDAGKRDDLDSYAVNIFGDDLSRSGVFYDGRSHLTFVGMKIIYLFDLKHNTFLGVLKTPKGWDWERAFLEQSPTKQNVFFAHLVYLLQEYKLKCHSVHNIFDGISQQCFISENFNFIGRNLKTSVEVFNVNTEQLLQSVLIDYETPATFICIKDDTDHGKGSSKTYLLYILNDTMHFESLQAFKTCTKEARLQISPSRNFISEDGLLSIHLKTDEFPTTREYFTNFYSAENGTLRKKSSSCFHIPVRIGALRGTHRDSILITPNHIMIHHISILDRLVGYNTKTKRFVRIKNQPNLLKTLTSVFTCSNVTKKLFFEINTDLLATVSLKLISMKKFA